MPKHLKSNGFERAVIRHSGQDASHARYEEERTVNVHAICEHRPSDEIKNKTTRRWSSEIPSSTTGPTGFLCSAAGMERAERGRPMRALASRSSASAGVMEIVLRARTPESAVEQ